MQIEKTYTLDRKDIKAMIAEHFNVRPDEVSFYFMNADPEDPREADHMSITIREKEPQ